MEFGKETEEIVHRFDVDMTDQERDILIRHAEKNMSNEERENMLINWSFIDIIRKAMDDAEKEETI